MSTVGLDDSMSRYGIKCTQIQAYPYESLKQHPKPPAYDRQKQDVHLRFEINQDIDCRGIQLFEGLGSSLTNDCLHMTHTGAV